MGFSQRLHELKDARHLSNYKLAKDLGCHQTTVANWLNGRVPHRIALQQIADYFDVSVEWLTGETNVKEVLSSVSRTAITDDSIDSELFELISHLSPAKKALLLEKAKMIEEI